METQGLRERKKARTRRHIADVAARLFGEHGYEQVTVTDVARAAEVSEQTVYNYFPGKERLVLDREDEIRDRLADLVRGRTPGTSPAAAVRDVVREDVAFLRALTVDQARGSLASLAAISPTIRRLALEAVDRQADAVAAAVVETTPGADPALAKVHAVAVAWVFQTILDEAGRHLRDGATPAVAADRVQPVVERILDDLDRRLGGPDPA